MNNQVTQRQTIDLWHRWGSLFIIVTGFLLHYLYDWSGRSNIIAMLAPVNESVWEHLKLGTWATVLFVLIEYPALRKSTSCYFGAKLGSIVTLNLSILAIFYGYQLFVEESILILDIGSYIIGVLCGQYVSRHIMNRSLGRIWNYIGSLGLMLLLFAFALFTWHPPEYDIFKDGNSNNFGIPR